MSEIVERVARALCDEDLWQCGGSDGTRLNPAMPNWHHYRKQARLTIEAMREPTEAMCEAGATYYHDNYQTGHAKEQTAAPDIWRAMIDEALKTEKV